MNPKRIVITGGPGTGKTSIIRQLEDSGYYCFHEIIRSMTLDAKKEEGRTDEFITNPLAFVSDPYMFNRKLLEGRVAQYHKAAEINEPFVFYDRGIPDVLAYMNYFKQDFGKEFKKACAAHKYDQVILLPPWEAIYISDNERMESFDEALEIHNYLKEAYTNFGYVPNTVARGSVAERTVFILNELNSER